MYFYIIQLFNYTYKEDIILALTSAGVMQGTYIEGENYDNFLSKEFPIFTGLFKTQREKERASALFFGMVDDKKVIQNVEKLLHDSGIENTKSEIYRIILLKGEK
jgi:hypothetical protein